MDDYTTSKVTIDGPSMRVPTILYVSLAVFLTACATPYYGDCGVSQTGEHQSFSELARSLKNSKSLERPPNKAAKKLKPIKGL